MGDGHHHSPGREETTEQGEHMHGEECFPNHVSVVIQNLSWYLSQLDLFCESRHRQTIENSSQAANTTLVQHQFLL